MDINVPAPLLHPLGLKTQHPFERISPNVTDNQPVRYVLSLYTGHPTRSLLLDQTPFILMLSTVHL